MKKIVVGFVVLFVTFAMVWAGAANAAEYPNKRLTYVICFNPAGESDITARIQEQALKKYFGQDVIITYKIGGGGAIGWSELVQAKPDGYTIAGHNLPHTVVQPMEMDNAGRVLLGVIDEVFQGFKGTVIPDHQDIRGALEKIDLLEVQGLIPGIAHFQRLEDSVGKVVTGDCVAVWLGLDQFRPADGAPASDLVSDNHILSEILFQGCLLDAGGDV